MLTVALGDRSMLKTEVWIWLLWTFWAGEPFFDFVLVAALIAVALLSLAKVPLVVFLA